MSLPARQICAGQDGFHQALHKPDRKALNCADTRGRSVVMSLTDELKLDGSHILFEHTNRRRKPERPFRGNSEAAAMTSDSELMKDIQALSTSYSRSAEEADKAKATSKAFRSSLELSEGRCSQLEHHIQVTAASH